MEKQVLESSEERTFQYQDSLPSLPVPPLDESLSKYLDAVKPFLNQEEYQRTEDIVKKFENGIGKELHQKLLERAKTRRNWLEDWWLNVAYLDLRISTQIHCNMAGPGPYIEHCWPPKEGTQIERACVNIWHTLKYWDLLRTEKVAIERSGNAVLDMNQFRMLFCTCRIPGVTRDSIGSYFKTGFDRHLLGLLLIAQEQGLPVPELYVDNAFTASGGGGNFILSTSLTGYTRFTGSALPMVYHGYSFFYAIRDDRIMTTCSSWKSCPETDAEVLCRTVFQCFQDMLQLTVAAQL
ncbi:peroxisomal carnitine O-octanoyltransferase isoform X2 [Athene noctua]|uniref:peroxisomal carnitine O-octanoyltransferase isoform X2 n=1 Tax=Athene noctua TaxID=126797 RepID=UPI003EBD0204